jgi:hypothetical protein
MVSLIGFHTSAFSKPGMHLVKSKLEYSALKKDENSKRKGRKIRN